MDETGTDETVTPSVGPLDADRLAAWLDTTDLPGRGAAARPSDLGGQPERDLRDPARRPALRAAQASGRRGREPQRRILREWRIIEALDGTDVPHTKAHAVCTDPSVLGGTFYLMASSTAGRP